VQDAELVGVLQRLGGLDAQLGHRPEVAWALTAAALCQQVGLLTNDALSVAVMQAHGLNKVASADSDFDRVPGIRRYAPA
jgi:predicted nucleic acid-binding protein